MKIISIGSSSSGNSYIIQAGDKLMILDAGLSCIKITRALDELGYSTDDVSAILITHEHGDHVKSIRTLANKCPDAFIYASPGTVESCDVFDAIDDERIVMLRAGEEEADDEVTIRAFALSHDASEPIGYSVIADGDKVSIVTDTGIVTDEIYEEISDASMLVLEANHDEHLLMYGSYPYYLKQRIKSDDGHLSNRAAGELLAEVLKDRADRLKDMTNTEDALHGRAFPVMLAHLSFNNNAPFRARASIEEILEDAGFKSDTDYTLTIAGKEELTIL